MGPGRIAQLIAGQLRSPLEAGEAMQARCQPIADGHPDVNAHYFRRWTSPALGRPLGAHECLAPRHPVERRGPRRTEDMWREVAWFATVAVDDVVSIAWGAGRPLCQSHVDLLEQGSLTVPVALARISRPSGPRGSCGREATRLQPLSRSYEDSAAESRLTRSFPRISAWCIRVSPC